MRIMALSAIMGMLLAGCTDPTEPEEDRFVGTCPAWTQGPDSMVFTIGFPFNGTKDQKSDNMTLFPLQRNDRPLDRIVLDFAAVGVQDARVEGRVTHLESGDRLLVRDFRYGPDQAAKQAVSIITFAGNQENLTFFVDLAPITGDAEPSGIRIDWTITRNLDGDPETPSGAAFNYEATPWYRVCGA